MLRQTRRQLGLLRLMILERPLWAVAPPLMAIPCGRFVQGETIELGTQLWKRSMRFLAILIAALALAGSFAGPVGAADRPAQPEFSQLLANGAGGFGNGEVEMGGKPDWDLRAPCEYRAP